MHSRLQSHLQRAVPQISDVADKLVKAVEPFGCQLVDGVMSHDLRQFVIDGEKVG